MITEFDFIKKYLSSKEKNSKYSLNFNDDVGLVDGKIYSTDTICEDIHFFSNDRPNLIAKKLIRVNVSDIVSKGVKPKYCLFNFSIGKNIDENWISNFMRGLRSDIQFFKLNLIGGDTTKTLDKTVLSLTIFGNLINDKFVRRSSAKSSDYIYVSGTIGDSALGLYCKKKEKVNILKKHKEFLLNRYLIPTPRIDLFNYINKNASASTDVSDGLYSDLSNICRTSNLGADIDFNAIPLSNSAKAIISKYPKLNKLILNGGDDYELLFTGKDGLDRNKNITKIGKMKKGYNINIADFNDITDLDGYKHKF
ncbi:MAG: thiamine-phosphate kinase [Rhizobiales bacterium TMED94]|nr:thiamine-phosphate kinase [Rhodobiaceae bacterium]RPF86028.1 MAG: thiamine-phosphate kinase [Rhizobiales bacterium TMED94]